MAINPTENGRRPSRAGMYFSLGVAAVAGACHLVHAVTVLERKNNLKLDQNTTSVITRGNPCGQTVQSDSLSRTLLGIDNHGQLLPLDQPTTAGADPQLAQLVRDKKVDPEAAVSTVAAQLKPLDNQPFVNLLDWADRPVVEAECFYSAKTSGYGLGVYKTFPAVDTGVARQAIIDELGKLPATTDPIPLCQPRWANFNRYESSAYHLNGTNVEENSSDHSFSVRIKGGQTSNYSLFSPAGALNYFFCSFNNSDDPSIQIAMGRKLMEKRALAIDFTNYACGLRGEIAETSGSAITFSVSAPPQSTACETDLTLNFLDDSNGSGKPSELIRIKFQVTP